MTLELKCIMSTVFDSLLVLSYFLESPANLPQENIKFCSKHFVRGRGDQSVSPRVQKVCVPGFPLQKPADRNHDLQNSFTFLQFLLAMNGVISPKQKISKISRRCWDTWWEKTGTGKKMPTRKGVGPLSGYYVMAKYGLVTCFTNFNRSIQ